MGDPPPPPTATKAAGQKDGSTTATTTVATDEAAKDGEDGERTTDTSPGGPSSEIYAEDWWKLSRPVFEFHGYYRVRSEFFHNFHLGRRDPVKPLWPRPPSDDYIDSQGDHQAVKLCGDDPDPSNQEPCDTSTHMGANMRFRFNPELHISDNVRIRAQIDLLDNIVLGSTPQGYANEPGADGRYSVVARGGYTPTGAFAATAWAPSAGITSTKDSIVVKRVWGEYSSPIGQLRFGRMPSHWGLGILANAGDGYDSDWQSTSDRLMFITGVKSWDLYFGAAWDFANEGAISAALNEQDGQPYDLAQQDDVDQWVFVVMRRMNEQLARKALRDGRPVFNGGAYVVYRQQTLANDTTDAASGASLGQSTDGVSSGYVRRGAEVVIPDLWFQFRFEKFRFELEGVMLYGSLENTNRTAGSDYLNSRVDGDDGWNIRQFGLATQTEYLAVEDRLKLQFGFGIASGDSDVDSLAPIGNELQPQLTLDRTFSTFRFHPDYRVDLILWRQVLTRVQGAYYFRPSVDYDFFRDPDGQRIGGGAAVIWSRASEFVQTPGHEHDLGVELNFKLYFQSKDGVLNDDPDKMGGFYTSLEYGVLFPLGGLDYLPGQVEEYNSRPRVEEALESDTAQTVRWYLGILF
ncbi:MAG: TIGR04551 family protein [Deltaproteobacteria bacterium]|nr:TIGR04551 family protein [Deltaproteobacteria bacterium]